MCIYLNSCIGYLLFLYVLFFLNMRVLFLIECCCIVIILRFIKIIIVKGFLVFYNMLFVDLYVLIFVCVLIIILQVYKLFLFVLFFLQIICMMIVVVVIYVICWFFLNIINIVGDIDFIIYDIKGMNYIWMLFYWFVMSNCMYNFFIYCWMNLKFRNGFWRVLSYFMCGYVKMVDEVELFYFWWMDIVNMLVGGSLFRYYKQMLVFMMLKDGLLV